MLSWYDGSISAKSTIDKRVSKAYEASGHEAPNTQAVVEFRAYKGDLKRKEQGKNPRAAYSPEYNTTTTGETYKADHKK